MKSEPNNKEDILLKKLNGAKKQVIRFYDETGRYMGQKEVFDTAEKVAEIATEMSKDIHNFGSLTISSQ